MKPVLTYGRALLLALLFLAGSVSGCTAKPLVPVQPQHAPPFMDDTPSDSLQKAVRSNLAYLDRQPPGTFVQRGGQKVPVARLVRSLELFLKILADDPAPAELDRRLKEQFDIFQATGKGRGDGGRNMLVTGYFQPVFAGSLTRQAPYLYPLYGVPEDLVQRCGSRDKGPAFGRREKGRLVPYWSRREIEQQQRAAGHELVWLKDPFDAYLVHIQGSALIQLPDGSRRGIHYAAKNGHPYHSIGSYLARTGRLPRATITMQTIRDYVAAHPEERDEIFYANPSFIFFAWTDTAAVIGSLGRELTPGRSVALDHDCFPAGGLGFLISRRPTVAAGDQVRWSPLHRFVLVQDSGSAISGSGRVDLFWGSGDKAGAEAGLMKEDGTLYFFLAKEQAAPQLSGQRPPARGQGS